MKPDFMPENLPGARHFNQAALHRETAGRMRNLADIMSAQMDKKWNGSVDKSTCDSMCNSNAYSAFNMAADPLQTKINDLRWEADKLSLKAAGHSAFGTVQKFAAKLGL